MTDPDRQMAIFLDIQRGLPRQGPGSAAATRAALALCGPLPPAPTVLDVGCGPGLQTIVLADATGGRVLAVDLFQEYLHQLAAMAADRGLADRIHPLCADMSQLPVPPGSADLVWSEGAAYILGVERAAREWRDLVRPGGCVVFSELVWLAGTPPEEAVAFFQAEYPAMTDIPGTLDRVRAGGLDPLSHTILPEAAWWDDYYTPLSAKLPALRDGYADDPEALALVAMTDREIEMRRRYADRYGYAFVIARRPV